MNASLFLLLMRMSEYELVGTGEPLDATFSQTRSKFGTRVTQRRPSTTTEGRMHLKENDSVET